MLCATTTKTWRREMLVMLLLMVAESGRSHQSATTADVTTDSDDVCISGCTCSATAIVCRSVDVLKSFPVLRSAAAASITDM